MLMGPMFASKLAAWALAQLPQLPLNLDFFGIFLLFGGLVVGKAGGLVMRWRKL
jgi:hypothetical protein